MTRTLRAALPLFTFFAAALLLLPVENAGGFTTLFHTLGPDQRDFRVFNNFEDPTANDDKSVHPEFPGYDGAVRAIWKGCIEWGSELHRSGSGDPHQPGDLGSGGANFDAHFLGEALSPGTINGNIISGISDCASDSLLGFTEGPGGFGWRIRICEGKEWDDGPGEDIGALYDLQGVAARQYGHALGLGSSSVQGATMYTAIVGKGLPLRSIEADDIAGIQSIYGAKDPAKPRITAVASNGDGTITITGTGFDDLDNQVRFSKKAKGGGGDPVLVAGVASTAGGTSIVVAVPSNAGPGDVLVRNDPIGGHTSMSNAWPFAPAPTIASLTPSSVVAVSPQGQGLVIAGDDFSAVTSVTVDGVALSTTSPTEFTVLSDETIRILRLPLLTKLGDVDVAVAGAFGSAQATLSVTANPTPVIDLFDSDPELLQSATGATVAMGSQPFDLFFLGLSPHLIPTVLPGIVSLGIGNGFASLVFLGSFPVDPVKGYTLAHFPFAAPLPPGTKLHFQAGVFAASGGSFPLVTTAIESGTVEM